jgi:hypothetical protein
MRTLIALIALVWVTLSMSGCGSSTQNQMVGKWEAGDGIKLAAEFRKDGKGRLTLFGQTIEGTYKVNDNDEMEWTVNGTTQKFKVKVNGNEMEINNGKDAITYKRV